MHLPAQYAAVLSAGLALIPMGARLLVAPLPDLRPGEPILIYDPAANFVRGANDSAALRALEQFHQAGSESSSELLKRLDQSGRTVVLANGTPAEVITVSRDKILVRVLTGDQANRRLLVLPSAGQKR